MSNRIQITVEVEPDFVVVNERDGAYSKFSYILAHDFCVVVDCEKDGTNKKYTSQKYHGIRIKDGKLQWLNPNIGWQIDENATKQYFDNLAEKTLLE